MHDAEAHAEVLVGHLARGLATTIRARRGRSRRSPTHAGERMFSPPQGLRYPRSDAPEFALVYRNVEVPRRVLYQRAHALAGQVQPRVARRHARRIKVQNLDALARQEADGQTALPGAPLRAR